MTTVLARYASPAQLTVQEMMNTQKTCRRCDETKAIDLFPRNRRAKDGRYAYCKDCARLKTIQWRKANPGARAAWDAAHPERVEQRRRRRQEHRNQPDYRRAEHLKGKYGITKADYLQLEIMQGGVCAICRSEVSGVFHIDHDHLTGRIRGLLCGHCNKAIGLFFDDPIRIQAAVLYLVNPPAYKSDEA